MIYMLMQSNKLKTTTVNYQSSGTDTNQEERFGTFCALPSWLKPFTVCALIQNYFPAPMENIYLDWTEELTHFVAME